MNQESKTSPLALIVFWLYVIFPLCWGVFNTLMASSKLFTN